MIKWTTILLALIGLAAGIYTVATSGRDLPGREPDRPPSMNPFGSAVVATGVVEAATRNVAAAAPQRGLVTHVHVQVTDTVERDQALFQLDDRPLKAALTEAKALVATRKAEYDRLASEPRPEDIPVLDAQLAAAKAQLEVERNLLELAQELRKERSETVEELERQRAEFEAARAQVRRREAELTRLRAGAWRKEIAIAQAAVGAAEARVEAIEIRLARLTVRSPIDGTVLKREIEPGEFVVPGEGPASMILGNLSTLRVRAQVNEEDMPRVREGAAAVARVRGPVRARAELRMLRIEPLAQPKRSLTGVTTELVDTRVIEVVFEVTASPDAPMYPGQVVDVFIEAGNAAGEPSGENDPKVRP